MKGRFVMYSDITRVALYVRVSTDEQVREGYSIEAQKASLVSYAKKNGYKIIDSYIDEGYTARKRFDKRKEFVRMLGDAKAGKFDLILFIKLDRWFRSVSDYYKIQEVLESCNVNWKTTLEDYDTSTASGRLNLNIRLSVNQDEADRTSERIKFVFEKKVADGEVISGSCPLGYMIEGKKLVLDPEMSHIAKAAFDVYIKARSRMAVVRHIRNVYGYEINYNTVYSMLSNTMYYGSYRGNNEYCEPLISKAQFDKAQDIMKKNYIKRTPSGRIYLFSGLLKCGTCGRALSGTFSKNPRDPEGGYYYYRCGSAVRNLDCDNRKRVPEEFIEKYLLDNIVAELGRFKVEYNLRQSAPIKPMVDKKKIERKLERLKELYINELIDLDTYKADFEVYKTQLDSLNVNKEESKVDFEELENILSGDFIEMYHSLDKEDKQDLWLSLLESVEVTEEREISIFFE